MVQPILFLFPCPCPILHITARRDCLPKATDSYNELHSQAMSALPIPKTPVDISLGKTRCCVGTGMQGYIEAHINPLSSF